MLGKLCFDRVFLVWAAVALIENLSCKGHLVGISRKAANLVTDDVTTSKSINATILKLITISKNFHGRFTANYLKFLSSTLIQRKT